MRSRAAALVVFAIAMVGLCSVPTFAQITQGRLTGVVTDSQGAVLPGATVTVTSPALIGVQTTVTQADGRYLFPALPSGVYTLTFALPDFQTLVRDAVQGVAGDDAHR